MFKKYYHTLIHLKPIQIYYQLWYRIRRLGRKLIGFKYTLSIPHESNPLTLTTWIEKPVSLVDGKFTFLNFSKKYTGDKIKWDETCYGKLWAYNLNYMDYLLQPGMNQEAGAKLIKQFIKELSVNKTGLESYPIALRGINWVKFLSQYSIFNTQYSNSLYAQYKVLLNNLEYHLLGNHLLEDGFSLLFGAFYFSDEKIYLKARQIIESQLSKQILEDGGHFELSPMYHQIILDRLLDSINLMQNNHRFDNQEKLLFFMQGQAKKMLSWLNVITFSNGYIPLLNDAAPGIAPSTRQLNQYALNLSLITEEIFREIRVNPNNLSKSGYRRINGDNYECIVDIGQIGPSYQPGHAHADTFNFVLNVNNEPFIVDTGISTYNVGNIRLKERGTIAHNTVTVLDKNSSEVWSSFRVARQAKVKIIKDNGKTVFAQHDGFRNLRTTYQREWNFLKNQIEITDTLTGKITEGKAHLWLAPQLDSKQNGQVVEVGNETITFENADSVELILTQIPNGYNHFLNSYKIEVAFKGNLKTIISIA